MKRLLLFLLLAIALPCHASRVVTDEAGRAVTLPDHPHRIICLVPSITDSVFALGAGPDVIAISDYVKYPAEARSRPTVGTILTPSIEKIVALHPDLVLGSPYQNERAVLDQFQRLNIPVFLVDPHGVQGILRSITSLGRATAREPQAAALVGHLQQRIDRVRASVAGKPAVSVFLAISYDPVITIGKGAFITDIIQLAGGQSITADLPQEWTEISMEAVIARAPQALLMRRGGQTSLAILKTRPGWSTLPAVRTGHVFYADDRLDFPSPVAIDALEELAHQFHP